MRAPDLRAFFARKTKYACEMPAIEDLEAAGYIVEPASSSVEAVHKAPLFSPDAGVVDML